MGQDKSLLSRDVPPIEAAGPQVLWNLSSQPPPLHFPSLCIPGEPWFVLGGVASFRSLSARRLVVPIHGEAVEFMNVVSTIARLTIFFMPHLPVLVVLGGRNKYHRLGAHTTDVYFLLVLEAVLSAG